MKKRRLLAVRVPRPQVKIMKKGVLVALLVNAAELHTPVVVSQQQAVVVQVVTMILPNHLVVNAAVWHHHRVPLLVPAPGWAAATVAPTAVGPIHASTAPVFIVSRPAADALGPVRVARPVAGNHHPQQAKAPVQAV